AASPISPGARSVGGQRLGVGHICPLRACNGRPARLAPDAGRLAGRVVAGYLMRLALKLYIGLVAASAILLLSYDLSVLASWPHSWSLGVTIALIVLSTLSDQIQFEVRRGWYTNASAVAHVATAFLLPPA